MSHEQLTFYEAQTISEMNEVHSGFAKSCTAAGDDSLHQLGRSGQALSGVCSTYPALQ